MARNNSVKGNFNYNNIEKTNKNFMYKNLRRSNCYNCNFSNSNFDFSTFRGAHFKSCDFYGASFIWTEFIGTNLKGSKFKAAKFENTVFEGVNLDGVEFKDAKFKNTIFVGTDINKARNLKFKQGEVRVFEGMPKINISEALEASIKSAMENRYVKTSRIFDTKDDGINLLNIMILLEHFDEEALIKGLGIIEREIDRDFYTLSYIIKFLKSREF
ncbi:Pentapeptide repeat-containing protein [Clostridium cavendishii DSM 21758]|uniref:Pentapeptide repeat-containing protein n=1 Tax=Clostridium cavendishii DSM 21758 TaxID=1121302 RepID=A0A1M6I8L2_9CLOT|nr:pentapeptide repeat-containing protein [Clostridium cavendishii]SHJ30723.1 Pentapeptide repeat-containing protein [Clostridium cavendishii DSM 21758]